MSCRLDVPAKWYSASTSCHHVHASERCTTAMSSCLLFPITCFRLPLPQRNTTGDDGLELWPDSASAANIGIMLFRKGAGKLAKVGCRL